MSTEEMMQVGNRVRIKGGLIEGAIVDVMWQGRYYVAWGDGCYGGVHLKDIERGL